MNACSSGSTIGHRVDKWEWFTSLLECGVCIFCKRRLYRDHKGVTSIRVTYT
jgi:hypothetical protein